MFTSVPDAGAVEVVVLDGGTVLARGTGKANLAFTIPVPASTRLWSPEDPFLYNLTVTYGADTVGSYVGIREVSKCSDRAVTVPCDRDV